MAINYAYNASFESALAGTWAASGVATAARVQGPPSAALGGWQCQLTGTGSGNPSLETDPAVYIPTVPGESWTLSSFYRWVTGTPKPVHLDLRWRDAAGVALGAELGGNFTPSASSWLRIPNNDNVAPAGAAFLSVRHVVVGIINGDVLAIDGVMAEKGNLDPPSVWTPGPDETPAVSGSVAVACRQALVGLLQARPGLSGIQCSYGYPGDDVVEKERIFTGRSRAEHTQAALKAGRRFRDESATFDVLIQVDLMNETIEATEARAFELGIEVETCVADNKYLGGVAGLNWAVVSGWSLNTGPTERGYMTQLIYTVTYQARLT